MARGTAPVAKLPQAIANHPGEYTPETQKMLNDLAQLGQCPADQLIRMVYRSLFGDPDTVGNLVRLWCRTLYRGRVTRGRRISGTRSSNHNNNNNSNGQNARAVVARFLQFLATAPALPYLRHHHIGGHERHAVYFFPFGTDPAMAAHLSVPMTHVDVRVVRALDLLANNPWAFRDVSEDPVFGCITYSCCSYTHEAQDKLDQCRPTFVAAAIRAIATQTRLELARSERLRLQTSASPTISTTDENLGPGRWTTHAASRLMAERQILAQTPSYSRAMLEQRVLSQVQQLTVPVTDSGKKTPEQRAAHELMVDAFRFVLQERTAQSLGYSNTTVGYDTMPMPTFAYSLLPTDPQIRLFATQTAEAWEQALDLARKAVDEA